MVPSIPVVLSRWFRSHVSSSGNDIAACGVPNQIKAGTQAGEDASHIIAQSLGCEVLRIVA